MNFKPFFALLAVACLASTANAQSLTTSFSQADGFTTGSTANVTFPGSGGLTATFSGGFQEQSFDGPAYNAGPEAYFFVNGTYTGSFGRTATGSTDVGTVSFSTGVDQVSFSAADRANGTGTFRVLDTSGATLLSQSIVATDNGTAAAAFSFDSSVDFDGSQIGSIEFDNAGPAANPPYVIAIDSFSASVNAVPEPSSMLFGLLVPAVAVLRRNRSKIAS